MKKQETIKYLEQLDTGISLVEYTVANFKNLCDIEKINEDQIWKYKNIMSNLEYVSNLLESETEKTLIKLRQKEEEKMNHKEFIEFAKEKVVEFENLFRTSDTKVKKEDVFITWSSKTLQNSKCLMSTPHKGSFYYEFTMNGDENQVYMDAYKKYKNIAYDIGDEKYGKVIY